MNAQHIADLITVLEATELTAEQAALLESLKQKAEALRAAQALSAGGQTAEAAVTALAWTADLVGYGGSRVATFTTGFFNALRK